MCLFKHWKNTLDTGSSTDREQFIAEIQWCVNHRPLGYRPGDEDVITPDHLRFGYVRKRYHNKLTTAAEASSSAVSPCRTDYMKAYLNELWPVLRNMVESESGSSTPTKYLDLVLLQCTKADKTTVP
jgi:hypothetical protein